MANGEGDSVGGVVAGAVLAAAGLTMAGGLISGLTLDFGSGDGGSDQVRYRLKVIALSASSIAFFAPVVAGALVIGLALLFALALANGASPGTARTVRSGVTLLAGLLALLTAAALVIDLTFFSEKDAGVGSVLGILVADMASMVVLATAVWAGVKATRGPA